MPDSDAMSDYQRIEIGPIEQWREHFGGFVPDRSRDGRRVLDHELPMQFVGVTANSLVPGEEAGYWHAHSSDEELYIFLTGTGQMGLDDDVVEVGPGTAIRVGQGVMRTWRALPDSPGPLTWFCIRGDGDALPHLPDDAHRITDVPMPW
jgi:mannose-6-phosphate isomerase-like protein (cupin superfamily)